MKQVFPLFLCLFFCKISDGHTSCGKRFSDTTSLFRRIVGGTQSAQGAWPWQVALLFNQTQFCGGSLISPHWVVSATHCFHDSYTSTKPSDWKAVLGEHHLVDKEVFEQSREIESIYLHPKYKSMFLEGIYDTPPDYDVALLRLSEPAIYDQYVSPICLLRPSMKFPWRKECYVTGWGHTQWNSAQPDILREAKVRLVPPQICNSVKSYNGTVHNRALCAGFEKGGVDACQYDSGGPLACKHRGRFYLTGIVSWGHECARPHKYGVYANMFKVTKWVEEVMGTYGFVEI
ncbi:plasminogen-like [Pocillopora verrucosa]|uniref:plasminogen-like n=1 Tax=Pocillopora verrucosa TaxID=203993 RepID=UPI0033401AE6